MTYIMDPVFLEKLLNLYAWLAASLIMVFISAIAHFYQKKFGKRTFFYIYIIPIIVLITPLMQVFPFLSSQEESIEFLGSLISFLAGYFLYRTMVGVK